jgi:hypothetical protein
MKKVLVTSFGIAVAALGAAALSAEGLAVRGPGADAGVAADRAATDWSRSEMTAVRIAQAGLPSGQATPGHQGGRTVVDDPDGPGDSEDDDRGGVDDDRR